MKEYLVAANAYLAAAVDELYELGVRHVVLSGGSRCTPLSLWFCEHGGFTTYMDIDERGAAFFALGIAKRTGEAVAVVCTSGSAGAHYLPAASESYFSRVPLLFLTADRPPESRNTGAPQTMDQHNILGSFGRYYEELAITPGDFRYPREVMRRAYLHVHGVSPGPVQINVPIREPLVPPLQSSLFAEGRYKRAFAVKKGTHPLPVDMAIHAGERMLIICGPQFDWVEAEGLLATAEKLQIPVLADPLSGLRAYASPVLIDSYDAFLKEEGHREALAADVILLLGQIPVSKRLQQWIAAQEAMVYEVDDALEGRNPGRNTSTVMTGSVSGLCDALTAGRCGDARYLGIWQKAQRAMRDILDGVCQEEGLFEGRLIAELQGILPAEANLVVSNSMPIRDVEFFWGARGQGVSILGNRGVNGIDGTISTALGVAAADKVHPTVLVTGDLSCLHDLNAWSVGKTADVPLVTILFNNDGGGIFQYLPQKQAPHFSYLFETPHGTDFSGVATLYGVTYHSPQTYMAYREAVQRALADIASGGSRRHLIEVRTDQARSFALHKPYTSPIPWEELC